MKLLPTVLTTLLLTGFLAASPITLPSTPCTPNLSVDGQSLPASCFGTTLGSSGDWLIGLEDLPDPFWDRDGNDLVALVSFAATKASFTMAGALAGLYSQLLVDGVVAFDTWSVVGSTYSGVPIDGLSVVFKVFYPGYAPVSYVVGTPNVLVECITADGCGDGMTPVPEPAYGWLLVSLLAGGIVGFLVNRRRK